MLKQTIKDYFKKGQEKEKEFVSLLSDQLEVKTASQDEDSNEHWDIEINNRFKIDIKAIKKDWRGGELNENIHWLEIRGVKDEGWLFGGKADYIAFETVDYWVIVDRLKIIEFVSNVCKNKIRTEDPKEALYKLYGRKGRNDVLTKVKTLDLMFLSDKIIKKP